MANYSKGDLQAMSAAFEHLFKVSKEVAKSPACTEWMENAAVGIVEYDGTLRGERSKNRDNRMEMYDVYDGIITGLVNYLRSIFKDQKSLSKWELIFYVYNEIMDVQKVIGQAESQVIFGTDEGQTEVPQSDEGLQMNQGSSYEEEPNQQSNANEQVHEETPQVEVAQATPAPSPETLEKPMDVSNPPAVETSETLTQVDESNTSTDEDDVEEANAEQQSFGDFVQDSDISDVPLSQDSTDDTEVVESAESSNVLNPVEDIAENVVTLQETAKESQGATYQQDSPTPTTYEQSSENADVEQSTSRKGVQNAPVADLGDASRSGNVQEQEEGPLFNTTNQSKMEEKEMAAVDELLKAAEGAASNPADVQSVPQSNVSAAKADVKEAQQKVSNILGGEKDARTAWTRSNTVTSLISTMRPAALRRLGDEGTVGTITDPQKKAEAIANKITGFVQLVSGRKGCTVDVFETLTDTEKYANVVPGETKVNEIPVSNVDKAKAIYELLKQVKQNPDLMVPAFIPAAPSFPTKGYYIGGTPYSTDEFMLELMDNSNGAIYGEDSITADGQEKEDAVFFRLGVAKKTEKAQAAAITTQKVEKKVPVVRAKNKKKFVEGEKHVVYLFTQEDTESQGKAAFRAMINVNGAAVAAGVAVYSLDDNGNKIVISHDNKNNKDRYKTRQASVSVSVPVTKILKEFAPEFKGNDEAVIAAARWNVNMGSGKAQGNFGQIAEFSQTPVFDVFTQVYAGAMPVTGSLKNSKALAALKSAADQQAASDAADAAGDLA